MAAPQVSALEVAPGVFMPSMGLGTFNSMKGDREVYNAVKTAIDVGYRHFDTAWIYMTEQDVGEAVADKIKEGVVTRKDVFIVTKLWNFFHAPEQVEPALQESLRLLQMDYVDLYLIHWPFAWQETKYDSMEELLSCEFKSLDIDLVDTWKAMERLVESGKVKAIGVSNFNQKQLTRILEAPGLKIKPAVNQVELHPYLAQKELVDFCHQKGISLTAYSPLVVAGVSYDGTPLPMSVPTDPVLKEIGAKYNKSAAQVALRWGVQKGWVVIPKSVTPSRIRENFEIFDFALSEEDMKTIATLDKGYRHNAFTRLASNPEYPF